MDSIKCEAFLVAAEHGSLTFAGAVLGYTQPGITRMIHSLEEELGFSLLVRSAKGVEPTDNGKQMIPFFREIVRNSKYVEEVSSDIKGILRGDIKIGSYFSISSMVLPPIIKKFTEDYPNIKISVVEGGNKDFERWLFERKVDFCFGGKPSDDMTWKWIPLFQDEQKVWLYEGHPNYENSCFQISQLQEENLIVTLPNGDNDMDRFVEKYDIKPNVLFSTSNAYTTYRMVESGLGISMEQSMIYKGFRGNVREVSFDLPQYIELGITMPKRSNVSPAAKKLIERIREEINQ